MFDAPPPPPPPPATHCRVFVFFFFLLFFFPHQTLKPNFKVQCPLPFPPPPPRPLSFFFFFFLLFFPRQTSKPDFKLPARPHVRTYRTSARPHVRTSARPRARAPARMAVRTESDNSKPWFQFRRARGDLRSHSASSKRAGEVAADPTISIPEALEELPQWITSTGCRWPWNGKIWRSRLPQPI